ncbi:MAG: bifunctional nuclease family protein, partial [Candidatus Binatia bacterium]
VLLKAKGRAVPIFVDPVVAESIDAELGGKKPPRPLTHDLMRTVLESLDAKVTKVSITLKGATYYADLTLSIKGKEKIFDGRSSDGIALALRFGAPIFVSEKLLQSAGKVMPDEGQEL